MVAAALRESFGDLVPEGSEILPLPDGTGHESVTKGHHHRPKRLDVNFSTPELGLELGVSIKAVNFPDRDTHWYGHNFDRIEHELLAEAAVIHYRQPFAILVGLLFFPSDAYEKPSPGRDASSFARAVERFRPRARRRDHTDPHDLLDAIFIGVYVLDGPERGEVRFFEVTEDPPRYGPPPADRSLTLDELASRMREIYDERNVAEEFRFADE
jgi:hypothetical protein